jgi:hypothetical protein
MTMRVSATVSKLKSEARNTKQIRNTKPKCSKRPNAARAGSEGKLGVSRLEPSNFGHSDLFRVSDFDIRI